MWIICLFGGAGPGLPGSPQSWKASGAGSGGESGPLLHSEKSEGDGVFGGVSMDGMGWSLKQADS